jgi:hypothetical protein
MRNKEREATNLLRERERFSFLLWSIDVSEESEDEIFYLFFNKKDFFFLS